MENKLTFVDYGCGDGLTAIGIEKKLNAQCLLGIDTWEEQLEKARKHIYILPIDINHYDYSVESDFGIFVHVLEHMQDTFAVAINLRLSFDACNDFLYIRGPYFDADEYLNSLGFKFNWSNWACHPTKITTDFINLLGYTTQFRYLTPVNDSSDPNILPLECPFDKGIFNKYLPEFGEKKLVKFDQPVYHQMECIIMKSNRFTFDELWRKL